MISGTLARYRNATPNEKAMRELAAQFKQELALDDDLIPAYILLDEHNETFYHWHLEGKSA